MGDNNPIGESARAIKVFGEMLRQDFYCHVAIHVGVIGFVDGSHTAFAQRRDDTIGSELLSG
ncbi:MAG: hypothetical protein AABZ58_04665 [Chloroflexota bacterium]